MKIGMSLIVAGILVLTLVGLSFFVGTMWKYQQSSAEQATPIKRALDKIPLDLKIGGMELSGIEKPTENCGYLEFSGEEKSKLFVTFCPKEIPESEIAFVKNNSLNTPPLEGHDYLYFFLSANITRETARERTWEFVKFIET